MKREVIYKEIECRDGVDSELRPWKEFFYYGLYDLIKKDKIFSKLPRELKNRKDISSFDSLSNLLKDLFLIPILAFRKIFLIKIEQVYHKKKYPMASMLADIKNENFDYLFVLNTRDHIITALPVLESLDDQANSLVVTFKSVYNRYRGDFNKLKRTKVLFFEYELSNHPLKEYLRIISESKDKFKLLGSQNLDSDLKRLIEIDKNFTKFHLKTELIQYYFFEKVFNAFDIKGVISIVFTTAFELAKEKNIPTFILQHGIGGKGHGHPYVSDYWFTLDDVSKESLDDWLDNTVNVLPLGSPRFEYLKSFASSKRDITNFNKRIDSREHKRYVTYITSGSKIVDNRTLILALKILRERLPSDINLIIKLHPRGEYNSKKEIKKIFSKEELEGTIFIKTEIDFYEILANSDVVITFASTGMLEAIAADIPTLQVNFTDFPLPKQYDLSSFGWRDPINDPGVMVNEVLSILSDNKRYEEVIEKQRWLKNRMFKNFGNCGKVIAETIINICERYKQGKGYDKIGV